MPITITQNLPELTGVNNPLQLRLASSNTGQGNSRTRYTFTVATTIASGEFFIMNGHRFTFSSNPQGQQLATIGAAFNDAPTYYAVIVMRISSNPAFSEWNVSATSNGLVMEHKQNGRNTIDFVTSVGLGTQFIVNSSLGSSNDFGATQSDYSIDSQVQSVFTNFIQSGFTNVDETISRFHTTYNQSNRFLIDIVEELRGLFAATPPTLGNNVFQFRQDMLRGYRVQSSEQYRRQAPTDAVPNPAFLNRGQIVSTGNRWVLPASKELGFDFTPYYNIAYTNLRTERRANTVVIRFEGNPNQGDFVNLGNTTYTFGTGANDLVIGSTLRATITTFLFHFLTNPNNSQDVIVNQDIQNSFATITFENIDSPFNADAQGNIKVIDAFAAGDLNTSDTNNKRILSDFSGERTLYGVDSNLFVSALINAPLNLGTVSNLNFFVRAIVEDGGGLSERIDSPLQSAASSGYYTINLRPSLYTNATDILRMVYQVFTRFTFGGLNYEVQVYDDIIVNVLEECVELTVQNFHFINELGGIESYEFVSTLAEAVRRTNGLANVSVDDVLTDVTPVQGIINDEFNVTYSITASVPAKDWRFMLNLIKAPAIWYEREGKVYPIRITASNWGNNDETTYNLNLSFQYLSTDNLTFAL